MGTIRQGDVMHEFWYGMLITVIIGLTALLALSYYI